MTTTDELATFIQETTYDDLSADVRDELKKRLVDSIGIAIGALGADPVDQVKQTVTATHGSGSCHLIGETTTASPPGAAMYNTTLTRYLDFMDSFLAPGETPHPSDNIGAALACADYQDVTGRELLAAIGIAYELQGEFAWNAPVRDKGWDHVTHTVITATAPAAKLLDLDHEATRNAIGIAGTAHNALRVTRTEGINEWKGIASANAARNAVYSAMLANNGMEGPVNLFEGQKGWKQIIAGDFSIDPDHTCSRVFDVMTKRYVAETYAQSAVEGIIELASEHDIQHDEVARIHLDTFEGAKLIIGGGEGDRHSVETKAQADHSLPYMLAAALIDRELTNEAYTQEQIQRDSVQRLLQTVTVEAREDLTEAFENGKMPAVIDIELEDGTSYHIEKEDFQGHPRNPMDWDTIEEKFTTMASQAYDESQQDAIISTVKNLEEYDVDELLSLLQ
ncbi:MAG: MmgE/PrpD family protein [Halobacteriaceae archaeon]